MLCISKTFISTALTPDQVQNLTATLDLQKPSVTLKWDPPANAGYQGDVTKYQIRLWDKEKSCYNEKTVNGSTTTTVITRELGLRPLTMSTFEVRACSGDDVSQEWQTVSTLSGMYVGIEQINSLIFIACMSKNCFVRFLLPELIAISGHAM